MIINIFLFSSIIIFLKKLRNTFVSRSQKWLFQGLGILDLGLAGPFHGAWWRPCAQTCEKSAPRASFTSRAPFSLVSKPQILIWLIPNLKNYLNFWSRAKAIWKIDHRYKLVVISRGSSHYHYKRLWKDKLRRLEIIEEIWTGTTRTSSRPDTGLITRKGLRNHPKTLGRCWIKRSKDTFTVILNEKIPTDFLKVLWYNTFHKGFWFRPFGPAWFPRATVLTTVDPHKSSIFRVKIIVCLEFFAYQNI